MSRQATLQKLEAVLESFLDRAISLKQNRMTVLDGINRLDDIAIDYSGPDDLVENVGEWFAQHSAWLSSEALRPADRGRIESILSGIKEELASTPGTPAQSKIRTEIDRWATESKRPAGQKLTLKRGPETAATQDDKGDSIARFKNQMTSMTGLFEQVSHKRQHLLSALDESLQRAEKLGDKQALILSGSIIYYLKQNGYKVQPYVARLKKAEQLQAGRS